MCRSNSFSHTCTSILSMHQPKILQTEVLSLKIYKRQHFLKRKIYTTKSNIVLFDILSGTKENHFD